MKLVEQAEVFFFLGKVVSSEVIFLESGLSGQLAYRVIVFLEN